ncbi:hypothetical protein OUZ56_006384 [Daphnia magna]|uniref:Uncharacterized protein n=1 Tax=Daphnia magna TaxID=35525 RepID=A0ABQ9YVH3_9CRUS|nr:hypothetical protein OUZ56_006384 [Daphnia magna]
MEHLRRLCVSFQTWNFPNKKDERADVHEEKRKCRHNVNLQPEKPEDVRSRHHLCYSPPYLTMRHSPFPHDRGGGKGGLFEYRRLFHFLFATAKKLLPAFCFYMCAESRLSGDHHPPLKSEPFPPSSLSYIATRHVLYDVILPGLTWVVVSAAVVASRAQSNRTTAIFRSFQSFNQFGL